MVLEEVSSDPDLYSSYDESPTSTIQTPRIDLSRLPSPMAFSGAWGYSSAKLLSEIALEHARNRTMLERPLTPEEADAISYHYAKGFRYASYGAPIGAAAGTWRAVATADSMRWPLLPRGWMSSTAWDFDKKTQSLSLDGKQLARGPWVRPMILAAKGSIYVSWGMLVGALLAGSYASAVSAVGFFRDPRLKALNEKTEEYVIKRYKNSNKSIQSSRTGQVDRTETSQGKVDPFGQRDRTPAELWRDHRRANGRRDDDASPTAGNDDFFNDEAERGRPGGNDSMLTDSQLQSQQRRQQPSPRRSPTEDRASTFQMEKTERQPRGFADDFDMTSPPAEARSPTSTASSGESAWDRIRRENASSNSSSSKARRPRWREGSEQEQQEVSTPGDSFTLSSSDSERAYAKAEAQKHFDERVEQERRGEDFDSGRSRKW